ncbi:MAG: M48 family metallopeptidase [Gammaproteobacteria bacterium]
MDFFARQEQSRRTSRVLVALFLLAFLACAVATTVVVGAALRLYLNSNAVFLGDQSWQQWVGTHAGFVAMMVGGTLAAMGLASLYRAATIARGGGQVARLLGATEVSGEGADPLQRRLVNVVEEMALAAGLPVPEIYILEQEAGINAFAAGMSPANAAITVTRGALERLDRAELQGVIAHEFSHVLNGDMRLNQQLMGLSFGILVLSIAGRWLLRSARYTRRDKNGGQAAALGIGLALVVIGAMGVLCSRLIKAAVARQRERLADASAVQFTREPEGLAGALKKIAGYGARIDSVDTEEVAHMLFEHSASAFTGWFATHPPLLERIRALEPNFDPRDLPEPSRLPPDPSSIPASANALRADFGQTPLAAAPLLDRAGHIDAPEVGSALRDAVPAEVAAAARSRDSSLLLVLALALSPDESARQRQMSFLEQQLGATRAGLCHRLAAELAPIDHGLYLPIVELTVPALKRRPAEELTYMFELLTRLDALNPEPQLFGFVLLHALRAFLRGTPVASPPRAVTPMDVRAAIRALLANIAAYGNDDAASARAAYAAGLASLGWQAGERDPSFDPLTAARDLATLDSALLSLTGLRPRSKQRLLHGVLACIQADGTITAAERELFRMLSATLDTPLPPGGP